MKKRILAILVTAIMLISIMPTTSMAKLTWSGNKMVDVDFSSFAKNTSGGSGASTVTLSGAGTEADYEPVGGLFGKAEDDIAAKITRITSSTSAASLTTRLKHNDNNCPVPGDTIDISWEWAFGDMNVERYLNATFYNTTAHAWNVVNSFSYNSRGSNLSDILCVSPNGSIRFFGKVLPKLYYFETDTWYNFGIRIKVGTDTDAENGVAGEKALAQLYVDGILIGEKEINNAKDDATTIYNPHCLYKFWFESKTVKYSAATEALAETTYIDNITSGKYRADVGNSPEYRFYRDYTITSKSDNFLTDGLHIALKNPMTVAELVADLFYIGGDTQGISSVTIADANRQTMADDALVTPGCYIVPRTQSGAHWHQWYRKIVDNITYLSNSYDGIEPADAPNGLVSTTNGEYSGTINYTFGEVATAGDVTKAFLIDKYGTVYAGALGARFDTKYKGTIDADKYVIEVKILRSPISDDYAPLLFRINSRTTVSIADNSITTHGPNDTWPVFSSKTGYLSNRWVKVAVEVDNVEKIAKIYIDGKYTGTDLTSAEWRSTNCYDNIGIATLCENLNSSFGKSYMDDLKIYSGSYTEEFNVASNDDKIVVSANDTLKVQSDVTAEEVIAATGADAIYAYANGAFGAEITTGVLPANAVAVIKADNSNIVKYYDIVYAPGMGEVTFDTSVAGKISANVVINNKSSLDMYKNAKLIIASYDNSGAGKKLVAVDFDANSALTVGENPLSATIDFDESKEVVAYLWKVNNTPYIEAVPYIG